MTRSDGEGARYDQIPVIGSDRLFVISTQVPQRNHIDFAENRIMKNYLRVTRKNPF